MNEEPVFVKQEVRISDTIYAEWLDAVKARYRQSQIKSAIKVNDELLRFYWSLGKDILSMQAEQKWGTGFFNQLSLDLRNAFPEQKGFSVTNLKYIKRWYLFYNQDNTIRQQVIDEFGHQLGDELEMPTDFAQIPWGHHIDIFTKSKSIEEALFYIHGTIEGNWSRNRLQNAISGNLFGKHGKALTNFVDKLPVTQNTLAQSILKDPYNLEFLNIRGEYDEKDLEDALVTNITRFLLELGKGFAYIGHQMELRMPNGQSYFPDMVFYHTRLKCYVVIELKVVEFAPEFAGKLNFYVTAADELLKAEDDNPSIGLLICKSKDKTIVEWSLRDIQKPIGVASYELQDIVDKTIAKITSKNNN